MPLREDDEGTCIHPGGPTTHDHYREVNCALSTLRPSEPSDCVRVAIRPQPPGATSAFKTLYGQVIGPQWTRSRFERSRPSGGRLRVILFGRATAISAVSSCVATLLRFVTRFRFNTHISNCPAKKSFLQVAVSKARRAAVSPTPPPDFRRRASDTALRLIIPNP